MQGKASCAALQTVWDQMGATTLCECVGVDNVDKVAHFHRVHSMTSFLSAWTSLPLLWLCMLVCCALSLAAVGSAQAQQISLNFHCKCEQFVHFATGSFFNFNGTAGTLPTLFLQQQQEFSRDLNSLQRGPPDGRITHRDLVLR